jgi:hypothetical protein
VRHHVIGIAFVLVMLGVAAPARSQNDPQFGTGAILADWIQISSQEWLKGTFHGMYDSKLEFDSSEFGEKAWDWDDIIQLRTMEPVEVGLVSGDIVVGRITVNRNEVTLMTEPPTKLTRGDIVTISRLAHSRGILKRWFAKVDLGITVLAGNTDENDFNVSGTVKRQSATDRVIGDYIANVSNSNNVKISNNQRVRLNWDRFRTPRFFYKPVASEWYSDPFQNINSRATVGVGAGYQILTKGNTQWEASGGIAYQRTDFSTVEAGTAQKSETPALTGATHLERKFTKAIKFTYDYNFNVVNESSGRYNHHMVGLIETKWTKALDLDVTLVWDRTQHPKQSANGTVPKSDDLRMVVSLGIDF